MKGIILAGGTGSRLFPVTRAVSKHLLPVYDKPMIYYPLSLLMLAGIKDVLIICRPVDVDLYRTLLGDGRGWGIRIGYAEQDTAGGLPQAFTIGRKFISGGPCALVLGDNILYGHNLSGLLQRAAASRRGATIMTYKTTSPERYGVLVRNKKGRPSRIVEKPKKWISDRAVIGLYFFDERVVKYAEKLKPSARGEVEITDLIRIYLKQGDLDVVPIGRGYAWFDSGTHDSLLQAATFVQAIEERQGLKIACPEEIAYRMGFIGRKEFEQCVALTPGSSYGAYLKRLSRDIAGGEFE